MPAIDSLNSYDKVRFNAQLSSNALQLLLRIEELNLVDNVLVRLVYRNDKSFVQAVISRALQPEFFCAFCDDPTNRHLFCDKMLGKIRTRYFWLGQTDYVIRNWQCCLDCQKLKLFDSTPVAFL